MSVPAALRLVVLAAAAAVAAGCGVSGDAPGNAMSTEGGETWGFVISMWRDEIPDVAPEHCPRRPERERGGVLRHRLGRSARSAAAAGKPAGGRGPDVPARRLPRPARAARPGASSRSTRTCRWRASTSTAWTRRAGTADSAPTTTSRARAASAASTTSTGRLLGCTRGFQPDGQIQRNADSGSFIKEGIPILLEVTGVHDARDDDDVRVRFASSADIVTLDAASPRGAVDQHGSLRRSRVR